MSARTERIREAIERQKEALDGLFGGPQRPRYTTLKQAFADFNAVPIADVRPEHVLAGLGSYDSARGRESADTATWPLILGDSITRRMVAEYNQPNLQTWRQIVSSTPPVNDFRTQRIDRLGGYGTLPTVGQGAPYQALTTPTNEEATYALTKRGGTEDLTLETVANDDVHLLQRLPVKLGLAAAQTLYRFVFDMLDTNITCTYDSVALFAAGHQNTASTALSGSAMDAARLAMRSQTAYGDPADLLGAVPKTLVVVKNLESLGFQLATSAVALPAGAPVGAATDIPNLYQGLNLIVVDYWSSSTKWVVVADPAMVPTIEIGFYQGREDPELFTQNDPTVGSAFAADKATFKLRHVYSGTILDHRGLFRGNS